MFWGFARVIWSGAAQREGWGRARRHPGDGDVSTSSTGGRARARGAQLTEASRTRAHSRGPQRTHVGLGFVGAAARRVWVHAPSRGSPRGNDPSAGSPTETLLRLHLPLNDKVKITSRGRRPREEAFDHDPRVSPDHSIGRCDGRCVQRAGT